MNIPSPYRLHLLGELSRQLEKRGVLFHCHFMSKGHKGRPDSWLNPKIDFPHSYWRNWGIDQHELNPGLMLKMLFTRPDWMICGSSFDTFTGIFVQLFGRAKTKLCWLEGNTKTPGKLDGFLGWFKRLVIGKCKYAAVPGQDAARYVGLHQARTKRTMPTPVFLPNLVDERRFSRNGSLSHDGGEDRVCIIPARLEPVKGLVPFFELLTPTMLSGWKIRVIGQGSLKDEVLASLARKGIGDFVDLVDYVPYEEMPREYAKADLMLLPSLSDLNPLSVIEALHSGLAVAVTSQAGNVEEAVSDGQNGWVLPVLDRDAFEKKLSEVFATPKDKLSAMGKISKDVKSRFWNTQESIARFLDKVLVD